MQREARESNGEEGSRRIYFRCHEILTAKCASPCVLKNILFGLTSVKMHFDLAEKVWKNNCPLGLGLCCSSGLDVVKKFTSLEGHFQYESQPQQSVVKGREDKEKTHRRRKRKGDTRRAR